MLLMGCGGAPFTVDPAGDTGAVSVPLDSGAPVEERPAPGCNGAPVYPGCPAGYGCACMPVDGSVWCWCVKGVDQ